MCWNGRKSLILKYAIGYFSKVSLRLMGYCSKHSRRCIYVLELSYRVGRLGKTSERNKMRTRGAAVVITAIAITGSASALANASGTKASQLRAQQRSDISRTFNVNGMTNMGGMRGNGGPIASVIAELVSKAQSLPQNQKLLQMHGLHLKQSSIQLLPNLQHLRLHQLQEI
jgi:hypothetical protein